jgi:hypothetical protein
MMNMRADEWERFRHTRWSVSQTFPKDLSLLTPPDPPARSPSPDGGASGIIRDSSTPESTVVILISSGNGTGERLGVSMVQLRAIAESESKDKGKEPVEEEERTDHCIESPSLC